MCVYIWKQICLEYRPLTCECKKAQFTSTFCLCCSGDWGQTNNIYVKNEFFVFIMYWLLRKAAMTALQYSIWRWMCMWCNVMVLCWTSIRALWPLNSSYVKWWGAPKLLHSRARNLQLEQKAVWPVLSDSLDMRMCKWLRVPPSDFLFIRDELFIFSNVSFRKNAYTEKHTELKILFPKIGTKILVSSHPNPPHILSLRFIYLTLLITVPSVVQRHCFTRNMIYFKWNGDYYNVSIRNPPFHKRIMLVTKWFFF